MLSNKDFRSQSEEESFKNGFLSRILIQISRISNSNQPVNYGQNEQYLTVEISPRFVPYEQQTAKRGIFDSIINNRDE